MPVVAARCTVCGANLQVDNSLKSAFCPYCGAEYDVQDAISNVTITKQYQVDNIQTMNIESLDKSKEMLRKGEAYLAEQDYAAAEKTFREYSDLLPGESDGWWGILRSRTKNMKNVVFSKTDLDGGLASLADRALKTAWGEDQQKKLKDWTAYQALWQKERPRIVSETQQKIQLLTQQRDAERSKEKKAQEEYTLYAKAKKSMKDKYHAKDPGARAWFLVKVAVCIFVAGALLEQLAMALLGNNDDFPVCRAIMISSVIPLIFALINLIRMLSWKKKIRAFAELEHESEQTMLKLRGSADKLDRQLQVKYDLLK